jgi:transcription initiation factor TFIID TATA-box-binding protein
MRQKRSIIITAEAEATLNDITDQIDALVLDKYVGCGQGSVPMHITNIVSLCDLRLPSGYKLNLKNICRLLYAKYSTSVFPAVISHCRETRCTHSLFDTGSIICTGARTTDDANASLILLVHVLNQYAGLGLHVQCYDFQVTNIVSACRLGVDIDMVRLTEDYQYNGGVYRADVFPGFKLQSIRRYDGSWTEDPISIYQPNKARGEFVVSYIIFSNGNCNVGREQTPYNANYQRLLTRTPCCPCAGDRYHTRGRRSRHRGELTPVTESLLSFHGVKRRACLLVVSEALLA